MHLVALAHQGPWIKLHKVRLSVQREVDQVFNGAHGPLPLPEHTYARECFA